jgi:hypothetical protein
LISHIACFFFFLWAPLDPGGSPNRPLVCALACPTTARPNMLTSIGVGQPCSDRIAIPTCDPGSCLADRSFYQPRRHGMGKEKGRDLRPEAGKGEAALEAPKRPTNERPRPCPQQLEGASLRPPLVVSRARPTQISGIFFTAAVASRPRPPLHLGTPPPSLSVPRANPIPRAALP